MQVEGFLDIFVKYINYLPSNNPTVHAPDHPVQSTTPGAAALTLSGLNCHASHEVSALVAAEFANHRLVKVLPAPPDVLNRATICAGFG